MSSTTTISVGNPITVDPAAAGAPFPDFLETTIPLVDGGFAVFWTRLHLASPNFSDGYEGFVQFYHADGTTNGAAVSLGVAPNDGISATSLANGNILVGRGVSSQIISPQGIAQGAKFSLPNTFAALQGGGFVGVGFSPSGTSLNVQRYDSSGNPVGQPIRAEASIVSTTNGLNSFDVSPIAAALADGGFVVAWSSNDGGRQVFAQRFDASGNRVGAEIQVAAVAGAIVSSIGALTSGGFVIGWSGPAGQPMAQLYDSSGRPLGAPVAVSGPVTGTLPNGGFITSGDANGEKLANLQFFNADGTTASIPFDLGLARLGNSIAVLSNGNIVAASRSLSGPLAEIISPQSNPTPDPEIPIVLKSLGSQTLVPGTSLLVSSLFVATDPDGDGDMITQYQVTDTTAGTGGSFIVNGAAASATQPLTLTPAQFASLRFQAGREAADTLQVQAFDGQVASNTAVSTIQAAPATFFAGPALGTSNQKLVPGQEVPVSALFVVESIVHAFRYRIVNNTNDPNAGSLLVGGTVQPPGQAIEVAPDQLQSVSVRGGSVPTSLSISVLAGQSWSTPQSFFVSPEEPPTVTAPDVRLAAGSQVSFDKLVSASDVDGDPITKFRITENTTAVGRASLNLITTTLVPGQMVETNSLFGFLTVGTVASSFTVSAFDGTNWSAPTTFTVGADLAPIVSAGNDLITSGSVVPVSSLFTTRDLDGDTTTQYTFTLGIDGNGVLLVNGVAQAAAIPVTVSASELSTVTFRGGNRPTSLSVAASDGIATGSTALTISPPSSPAPTTSFSGLSLDQVGSLTGFVFVPPDPNGAVSTSSIVEVTNGGIEWFSKSGAAQHTQSLFSFFGVTINAQLSDPRVVYDATAGRFVVSAFTDPVDGSTPSLLLAESRDANPNDGWIFQRHAFTDIVAGQHVIPDFPSLGTNGSDVFVSVNLFGASNFAQLGSRLLTFSFANLANEAGTASSPAADTGVVVSDPSTASGLSSDLDTLMPAKTAGGTGGPEFFVSYSGVHSGVDTIVTVVTDTNPLNPVFTSKRIDVGHIDAFNPNGPDMSAAQPGGQLAIDADDARVTDAVVRNGRLYAVANILPVSGPNAGLPTVHWWVFDVTTPGNPTLLDQGDVDGSAIAPGTGTFDGSIAVDGAGQFLINFSASGPSVDPGSYYAVHRVGDPAGTLETPVALAPGQSTYVRTLGFGANRWGDNSAVVMDPSNPGTFWLFNQFAQTPGPADSIGETGRWGTKIGSVTLSQPPLIPTGPGNNTFVGGGGFNTIDYSTAPAGVSVNLATGTATNGFGGTDTLSNIQNIIGSNFDDTLVGDSGNNTLIGGGGNNTIDGGGGFDTVVYVAASSPTQKDVINLATGTAQNEFGGTDTLRNIEGVILAGAGGTVIGGTGTEVLTATGSGDTLIAGTGAQTLTAAGSGDTLVGNAGGSTLQATGPGAVLSYAANNLTVDLAAGSATVSGSGVSDKLIGTFASATVTGNNATLVGSIGTQTLTVTGSNGTIVAGNGVKTLIGTAGGNTTVSFANTTGALVAPQANGENLALFSQQFDNSAWASQGVTIGADAVVAPDGTQTAEKLTVRTGTINPALWQGFTAIAGNTYTLSAFAKADGMNFLALDFGSGSNRAWFNLANGTVGTAMPGVTTSISSVGNGWYRASVTFVAPSSGQYVELSAHSADNETRTTGNGSTGIDVWGAQLNNGSTAQPYTITTSAPTPLDISGTGGVVITMTFPGAGFGSSGNLATNALAPKAASASSAGVVVNLATGATGGAAQGDVLTNITNLVGSSGNDTLTGLATGGSTLTAGSGNSALIGLGNNNVLRAGAGTDLLTVTGSGNTLVGGSGTSTLASGAGGNTLIAGTGQTIAAYAANTMVIDLGLGTATVAGSGVSDTLVGITAATASGSNATLIAGTGANLLVAAGSNDTLVGNAGGATLQATGPGAALSYAANNVTVDLAAGKATVAGATVSDKLMGTFASATVSGANATLVGSTGTQTLRATGSNDTLVAGSGTETLIGAAGGNTTVSFANATGAAPVSQGGGENLALFSQQFENTAWASQGVTIGANAVVAPDGAQTAEKLTVRTGTINPAVWQGFTAIAGNTYTLSAFAKADGMSFLALDFGSGSNRAWFNLSNGTVGTVTSGVTASISSVGNGWFRASVTFVAPSSGQYVELSAHSADDETRTTGNGSTGIDVWGAQLNNGSTALSYTATTNAPATGGTGGAGPILASASSPGVVVNLATDATGGAAQGDVLTNVTNLVGSSGNDTLTGLAAGGSTLTAGSGNSTLTGLGNNNVLRAGAGTDLLTVMGSGNTLVGGSGTSTLSSTAGGNTLIAGTGQTIATYAANTMVIDLGLGTATVAGSGVSDTLVGITAATASGSGATLIAGTGSETLTAAGSNDTLVGNGSGATLQATGTGTALSYAANNVTVDLAAGKATVAGATVSDKLMGTFASATVSGANATLVGSTGPQTLRATGSNDTLVAGSGIETLIGAAGGNTTVSFANATGAAPVTSQGGGTENLALFSQQFDNPAWASQGVTIGADAVVAPDGTQTAERLTVRTGTINPALWQGFTAIAGNTYTLSAFAKADGMNFLALDFGSGSNRAWFNLANGTVGTAMPGVTTSISSVGNGWFRASVTFVAPSSGQYVELSAHSADNETRTTGNGSTGIDIWGAQLNNGSTALSYTSTTSTPATTGVGGIVTLAPRSAATTGENLALFSQQFDNAAWSSQGVTIGADAVVAPDGTQTAEKLTVRTGTINPALWQGFTAIAGNTYTLSVFAKADGMNFLALDFGSGSNRAWFDLANGRVGTAMPGVTTSISSVGNGWFRASVTFVAPSSGQYVELSAHSADNETKTTGNGSTGIDVWGAQLNNGSTALSYTPTTSGPALGSSVGTSGGSSGGAIGVTADLGSGTVTGALSGDVLTNVQNLIGSAGNDTLTGNSGSNVLDGGAGNDTLIGGGGSDLYKFARGGGQDEIQNASAANLVASGELDFGPGVSINQLWFLRTASGVASASGSDLQIDVLGTSDHVTIDGWFANSNAQLAEITTADGSKIDTGVAQLVQAMATFSAAHSLFDPTLSSVTQAPNDATLQTALASAWHH